MEISASGSKGPRGCPMGLGAVKRLNSLGDRKSHQLEHDRLAEERSGRKEVPIVLSAILRNEKANPLENCAVGDDRKR